MKKILITLTTTALFVLCLPSGVRGGGGKQDLKPEFHTSDRCLACHNQLTTESGKDVSIGTAWRASIMANSGRDPYWQGSIRRETIDHPTVTKEIEDECSACHMPITRYEAKVRGEKGPVFQFLPLDGHHKDSDKAADGVTCSVCHQISTKKLGTRESYSGQFEIDAPKEKTNRPEYGPFEVAPAQQLIMESSTGGYRPTQSAHIRDSALCATCHQLYTTTRGKNGEKIGELPEQVPYLEYLHSDAPKTYTCQSCHMPEVTEPTQISSVLGLIRTGARRHTFIGGNFLMTQILNRYRNELSVAALPEELNEDREATLQFLQTQAARVSISNVETDGGKLSASVRVENLAGHKLPTAYPSRRAWIHFVVSDSAGRVVFESGALNADGSIAGNDNDADKTKFEPHYRTITRADEVQIFEDILKDSEGNVTTGLLSGIVYGKDNRLLPAGFDKASAEKDIAVIGDAADDPAFVGGSDTVRYEVPLGDARGTLEIKVELMYQPIGFRWAHNLEPYKQDEPQRFVGYYNAMMGANATVLASATAKK